MVIYIFFLPIKQKCAIYVIIIIHLFISFQNEAKSYLTYKPDRNTKVIQPKTNQFTHQVCRDTLRNGSKLQASRCYKTERPLAALTVDAEYRLLCLIQGAKCNCLSMVILVK